MRAEVPRRLDGRVFDALKAVLEERRPAPSADTVLSRFAGER